MSFYQQYPQPEMELGTKLVLAACRFGTPIVYIGTLSLLYFTDQENALATNFTLGDMDVSLIQLVGTLFLIVYILTLFAFVPFLKKMLQKQLYLRTYGKKVDAVCASVKKGAFVTTQTVYSFLIQGVECIIKEDNNNNAVSWLGEANTKENDIVPIIYNPEDPTDCILDEDKFKNK